jgi:glycosyltransferase involved in cell wall biosynthesis
VIRRALRSAFLRARRAASAVGRPIATEIDRARFRRRGGADLALFHEFAPPPTGGGHQFLRALVSELERRGVTVEVNRISAGTRVCLCNSFNFDFRRLRRFARADCRLVHRVDGPISVYRGWDDGTDGRIARVNRDLADATILQSRFSLDAHRELGIELTAPTVVRNAVDPTLFHSPRTREPLRGRRLRIVATSWSNNPNKGADVFRWLDRHLDTERFELTFVGRAPEPFSRIRALGPLTPAALADELRRHDAYLAASVNDPCSNALLEGLACGLPAAFRASGGHPELVGEGGLPFSDPAELPEVFARLAAELEERRSAIQVTPLSEVASRYLEVLGL